MPLIATVCASTTGKSTHPLYCSAAGANGIVLKRPAASHTSCRALWLADGRLVTLLVGEMRGVGICVRACPEDTDSTPRGNVLQPRHCSCW